MRKKKPGGSQILPPYAAPISTLFADLIDVIVQGPLSSSIFCKRPNRDIYQTRNSHQNRLRDVLLISMLNQRAAWEMQKRKLESKPKVVGRMPSAVDQF